MNDAAAGLLRQPRLVLIKPKIDGVAHVIIAAQRRDFVKPQLDRAEPEASRRQPRASADILMEYAAMDHVTGEAEPPRAVAIFKVTPVEDVIRLRQTDLPNCVDPVERAGP